MGQKIPKTKRNLKAFLLSEECKLSKEALLKTGVFLSGVTLSAILSAPPSEAAHTNSLALTYPNDAATATHTHSTATGTATGTGTGTGTYY